MNYAILASGNLGLGCLRFLHRYRPLNFVFTDRASVEIVQYCNAHSIPCFVGLPRNQAATDFLSSFQTDVLFSTNYLFMVERDVLTHPTRFAINFHGSLLPKYRGRAPHIWAIINGENKTGVTAHLMESGCDTGDIVLQQSVAIGSSDSGAAILEKYKSIYPQMMVNVIEMVESNSVNAVPQDHSEASYFPKRTPADGEIDWSWNYDRIHNWVRALRHPYPGAFTFIGGSKIVVQNVRRIPVAFDCQAKNGSVLSISPTIIKSADCPVEIVDDSESSEFSSNSTGNRLGTMPSDS